MAFGLRKNRNIVLLVGIIMVISLWIGGNNTCAAETTNLENTSQIQVFINGVNSTDNPSTRGVQPLLINNKTYLPIRTIAEQMGIPVLWVPETNSVYIGDVSRSPNLAYEKEFLHLFAKDYKSGQPLSDKIIAQLNQMRTVLNASGFVGGLQYSLLDMAWHTVTEPVNTSVEDFEDQLLNDIRLLPPVPGSINSINFSHLFDGGYAAGYYGYIWAHVLDADAYQVFKQNGMMSRKTGEMFRDKVLSKGASVDPMLLFKDLPGPSDS